MKKKSYIFSSDFEVNIRLKQKLLIDLKNWLTVQIEGLDAVNGIVVLKSVESFNLTEMHNLAQGEHITLSVLVLLLLDSSDQDLSVFFKPGHCDFRAQELQSQPVQSPHTEEQDAVFFTK